MREAVAIPIMINTMNNTFEQAASFQKIWMDSVTNMAGAFSQFSPASPPPEQLRGLRTSMLKVLGETWNEFMRSPQFMEVMKLSINGAFDMRTMMKENMNKIHEQFETPTKEDVDGILLAIRHVERRVLDRLEGMEERLGNYTDGLEQIEARLEKLDARIGKTTQRGETAPSPAKRNEGRTRAPLRKPKTTIKPKKRSRK